MPKITKQNWQVLQLNKKPASSPVYVYKQYVWSLRYIDALICRFRDTNDDGRLDETLYYAEDANFNVAALVSKSGAVVERYTYSAYGKVSIYSANWTSQTSSSYDNDILFAGYRWDKESGLYQVRNRMYNPSLGRWLQRDPMGYLEGLNLYVYVNGNTIILVDPMGLVDWLAFGTGVAHVVEGSSLVAIGVALGPETLGLSLSISSYGAYKAGHGLAQAVGSFTKHPWAVYKHPIPSPGWLGTADLLRKENNYLGGQINTRNKNGINQYGNFRNKTSMDNNFKNLRLTPKAKQNIVDFIKKLNNTSDTNKKQNSCAGR